MARMNPDYAEVAGTRKAMRMPRPGTTKFERGTFLANAFIRAHPSNPWLDRTGFSSTTNFPL
jgi:hypothetical protein